MTRRRRRSRPPPRQQQQRLGLVTNTSAASPAAARGGGSEDGHCAGGQPLPSDAAGVRRRPPRRGRGLWGAPTCAGAERGTISRRRHAALKALGGTREGERVGWGSRVGWWGVGWGGGRAGHAAQRI